LTEINLENSNGSISQHYGPINDAFAKNWLIDVFERSNPSERPEGWHKNLTGSLGLKMDVAKNNDGIRVTININPRAFKEWAEAHLYMLEDFMTFRIGPIIFAHPGRDQRPISANDETMKKPINIWEMEFAIIDKEGHQWFNLFKTSVAFTIDQVHDEYKVCRVK